MPPDFQTLKNLPEAEMVAAQIDGIEKQINSDLKRFPRENHRIIQLNDLSPEIVMEIATWLGLGRRNGGTLPEFRRDSVIGSRVLE